MFFFILTIICNLLAPGYLQETNNVEDFNLIQPDIGQNIGNEWPLQSFHTVQGNVYGQTQRNIPQKPCSRRSNSESEPISQHLSPQLAPKLENLSPGVTSLKPQSLRNGDYSSKATDNQAPFTSSKLINDVNDLYSTRNSFTVTNPVIDSLEENHREILPTINHEIHEENPSNHMRSESINDSSSASVNGDKTERSYQSPTSTVLRTEPTNEHRAEPEIHYVPQPRNSITSDPSGLRSNKKADAFPELTGEYHTIPIHTLPPELITKLRSEPNEAASSVPVKCSHEKEPDNLLEHSRRFFSGNDEDSAREDDNDPFAESRIDNDNAMASILDTEKNTLNSSKDQLITNFNKSNSPSYEKSVKRVGRPQYNDARREMIEPTKGAVSMSQSSLMMMQTERICYACSTANNPSCWAPDRRTTVKYCRKGNNACITKTFGKGSTFTLIRDCGKSCDDTDMTGLMPKYKSCSMCHTDLCNGAYSISGHSMTFALFLIAFVKYFN